MVSFSPATRVFVATAPVDLRGSFNKLFALTQGVLQQDPLSGHWFVFTNRHRNRLKILFWDGTGLWLLTKRLEKGTFSWPKQIDPDKTTLRLNPQALAMLTDGVDLRGAKLRPWYEREA